VRAVLISCVGLIGCGFELRGAASGGDDMPIDARTNADGSLDMPTNMACAAMWMFDASNVDPCAQGTPLGGLTLGPGTYEYVPSTGALTLNGGAFMTLPTTGTSLRVLSLDGLTISSGANVVILGPDALAIVVHGSASIDGRLDVSATGTSSGPGAGNCAAAKGTDMGVNPAYGAGGGGAGGSFGGAGGGGGDGDVIAGSPRTPGGPVMALQGDGMLVPLRGGCRGGAGGEEDPSCTGTGTPGAGGGGGGALQLTVRDTLTLGTGAQLAANGGGAAPGVNVHASGPHLGVGGGGGGSGGGLLVEAAHLGIDANAILCANGGGGSGGTHNNDGLPYTSGGNGACATNTTASGGNGEAADGGDGATGSAAAGRGVNGSRLDDGGGGGGGSVGRIRVRAAVGPNPSYLLASGHVTSGGGNAGRASK
jgi:hypothetical protein